MSFESPKINIIICTFNRLNYLKQCLAPILKSASKHPFLITVVDNNSTDGTAEYLKHITGMLKNVQYVFEPVQGLSHARNSGWKSSELEWTLYLDDECIPSPVLPDIAYEIIHEHPEACALGGPIFTIYTGEIPDWLPQGFEDFTLPFDKYTALESNYLRGGCLMIQRSVFLEIGGFHHALGVVGQTLRYGEEIELQHRMRERKMVIGYHPALKIGHQMRPEKTRLGWILHSEYARRRDKVSFEPVPVLLSLWRFIRTCASRIIHLPIYALRVITRKNYSFKKGLLEILKPFMYRSGELVGSIKYFLGVRK